jgi:ABC-type multidrug transport system ATPase subunit
VSEHGTTTDERLRTCDVGVSHAVAVDAVAASALTVRLARRRILDQVCFSLSERESVALLGANGAGKTTLLKCLAGLVRPTSGEVRWFGDTTRRVPSVQSRIGFVGHEHGLYLELSPRENLLLAARLHGVKNAHGRADFWLRATRLERCVGQPTRRLSKGMRQRLATARAVIHDPCLVLLDEPFVSLDAEGRAWLSDLLTSWRQEGRAICFTSHDPAACEPLADRLVRLHEGHIEPIEPPVIESSVRVASSLRRAA